MASFYSASSNPQPELRMNLSLSKRKTGDFPSRRPSGTLHSIQARAVFGSKRFSEWSDPVQHMCT